MLPSLYAQVRQSGDGRGRHATPRSDTHTDDGVSVGRGKRPMHAGRENLDENSN